MKIKITLIFTLSIICLITFCFGTISANSDQNKQKPLAVEGVLDLETWNFKEDGPLRISGEWEFYWNELLYPEDFEKTPETPVLKKFFNVPGWWDEGVGFATYRLVILVNQGNDYLAISAPFVMNSYKIWVDGELLSNIGEVGVSPAEVRPEWRKQMLHFPVKDHKVEIIMQVANFHHNIGGVDTLHIGTYEDISRQRDFNIMLEAFIRGILFIMGIYHLVLYFVRRKELSAVYFSAVCFAGALRFWAYGEIMINDIFNISWEWHYKMLLISILAGAVFFALFIQSLYPDEIPEKVSQKVFGPLGVVALLLILLLPVKTISSLENHAIVVMFGFLIYLIYCLVRAYANKRHGVKIFIVTGVIFLVFVINDFLLRQNIIDSVYLMPFGAGVVIFFQVYLLSDRYAKSYKKIEGLKDELLKTNEAYVRFVPKEFLNFLKKDNIVNIELGDQVEAEMTLFFSDIRSFTTISEKMTPEEIFNYLNSYLKEMGPIIRAHGGFIDKFIGDSIMALFPDDPENALQAAIAMQKKIKELNVALAQNKNHPIKVGMGIHTGKMMIGTIGEAERMEGTVISDAVNLAARLESLTKKYRTSIIISQEAFNKISGHQKYNTRFLGQVAVKGKIEKVGIIEVLD